MPSTRKILPARITARWLQSRGACEEALSIFRETFPRGVGKITTATIRKAKEAGLSIDWLSNLINARLTRGPYIDCCCRNCDSRSAAQLARELRLYQKAEARNA